MAGIKRIAINKGAVGANAALPETSTSALIIFLSPVSDIDDEIVTNVAFGEVAKITSLDEAVGIIPVNFDTEYHQVAYRQLLEFYTMAGEGTELYVMLLNSETVSVATALEDTGNIYAKKLLVEGKGTIKQLGVCINPYVGTTETRTDGLSTLVRAAISKAQLLYNWAYDNDKPCQILLEGRNISTSLNTLLNLHAIPVGDTILNANKVSIVIGQDWDFANYSYQTNDVEPYEYAYPFANYASVGKALGTVSAAAVNQSIGEVDEATGGFNLTDSLKGYFVTGGLSNHQTLKTADAFLGNLDDKGYIFPYSLFGVSGLRWNGDHVCCPIVIDDNGNINEHTIFYGRTMDYTALALKLHFTRYLKKRAFADVTTGNLSTGVIKVMEKTANTEVFGKLFNNQLISGGETTIDKNSDLVTPPKKLKIGFVLVPTIIIDSIEGTIFLNRSL